MQTRLLSLSSPAAESTACAGALTMKLAAEKCSAHKLADTEISSHASAFLQLQYILYMMKVT